MQLISIHNRHRCSCVVVVFVFYCNYWLDSQLHMLLTYAAKVATIHAVYRQLQA